MKYGKLINEILIAAPSMLIIGDSTYYQPSRAMYLEQGYLPIIETSYPEIDEKNPVYYESTYKEIDGKIVKIWIEAEPQEEISQSNIEDQITSLNTSITDIELALCEIYEAMEV